jgi:hypothetical protein
MNASLGCTTVQRKYGKLLVCAPAITTGLRYDETTWTLHVRARQQKAQRATGDYYKQEKTMIMYDALNDRFC